MSPVLRIENLSKTFALYDGARQRLLELIFGGCRHRLHHVLNDINFSIQPGESVGILGVNGAGKSTLLKLIMRVLLPDSGRVISQGRVAGLLELGTGFDFRLTGRENIYINGQLYGLTRQEITTKLESIINFSELAKVIDDPIRTYSSGMVMRLGFSIAIHVNPSCFILDEALAVGDAAFQQKCLLRLQKLREEGTSLLVVSHDLNAMHLLCDRCILIDKGKILVEGSPQKVSQAYLKLIAGYQEETDLSDANYGKQNVKISSVRMSCNGEFRDKFLSGESAEILIDIDSSISRELSLGFLIRDRFGQEVFGINTAMLNYPIKLVANHKHCYKWTLPLSISPGHYTLSLALHGGVTHLNDCEHWWDQAMTFEINGFLELPFAGICNLPVAIENLTVLNNESIAR